MKLPTSGWKPGRGRVPSAFLECASFEFNLSRTSFACRSGSTCRRSSSKMTKSPSVCLKNQFLLCQIKAFSLLKIITSSPHRKTSSSRSLYFCHNAISCWPIVSNCFDLGKLQAYPSYLYSALSNLICCGLGARPVQSVSSKPVGACIIW